MRRTLIKSHLWRSFVIRLSSPILCILLHPGTVDTDLSKPFQRNVPEGTLVQGAYRGIGLEFDRPDRTLKSNPGQHRGLLVCSLNIDITTESSIEASAEFIRERYGSFNLLINASGILSIPNVIQPETTPSKVEKSSLMLVYEVNAVGPLLMIKHMWPLLKAGGGNGTERDVAVVASLSARVASIGDNRLGGWHSYRASKTALNQSTKTVSVELARKKDPIVCIFTTKSMLTIFPLMLQVLRTSLSNRLQVACRRQSLLLAVRFGFIFAN